MSSSARGSSGARVTVVTAQPPSSSEASRSRSGFAHVLGRVRARPCLADERPFEMGSENPGAPGLSVGGRLADRREGQPSELRRRGDQGRLIPEHPRAGELDPELEDLAGGGLEYVDAAKPVHLEVDEAGDRETVRAARQADGDDAPVLDLDVPSHERPVHDGGGDTELHGPRLRRAGRLNRVGRTGSVAVSV